MDRGGSKFELQTIQEIAPDADLNIRYGEQTEDQKIKYKVSNPLPGWCAIIRVLSDLYGHETLLQGGQTHGESKADLVPR